MEKLIAQYPAALQAFFRQHVNFTALQAHSDFNADDLLTSVAFGCDDTIVQALLAICTPDSVALLSKHAHFEKSFMWGLLAKHPALLTDAIQPFFGHFSGDAQLQLLAGKKRCFHSMSLSLMTLPQACALFLIQQLKAQSRTDTLKIFATGNHYAGLVDSLTLEKKPDEAVIFAVLDWVWGYANDDIKAIVQGRNGGLRLFNAPNLMILLCHHYSQAVVKQAWDMFSERFSLAELWGWLAHEYTATTDTGEEMARSGFSRLLARPELYEVACEAVTMFSLNADTRTLFQKNFWTLFRIPFVNRQVKLNIHMLMTGVQFIEIPVNTYGALVKVWPAFHWYQAAIKNDTPDMCIFDLPAQTDAIRQFQWLEDETLLHVAVRLQKASWVAYLVGHGWRRTIANNRGQYPIHSALLARDEQVKVAFLSQFHEDWLLENKQGQTSLALLLAYPDLLVQWFSKVNKAKKAWPAIDNVMQTLPLPSTLDFSVLFREVSAYYVTLKADVFIAHVQAFLSTLDDATLVSVWLSNLTFAQKQGLSQKLTDNAKRLFDAGLAARIQAHAFKTPAFELHQEMSLLSPEFKVKVAQVLLLKTSLDAVSISDLKRLGQVLDDNAWSAVCQQKSDVILMTLAYVIPALTVIPAKAGNHPGRGTVPMQKWVPAFAGMTDVGTDSARTADVFYRVLGLIDADPLKQETLAWLKTPEGMQVVQRCDLESADPIPPGSVWEAIIIENYMTGECPGFSRLNTKAAIKILQAKPKANADEVQAVTTLLFSHPKAAQLWKALRTELLFYGACVPEFPEIDAEFLVSLKAFWRYFVTATPLITLLLTSNNDKKNALETPDKQALFKSFEALCQLAHVLGDANLLKGLNGDTSYPFETLQQRLRHMLAIKQQVFVLMTGAYLRAKNISALTALLDESGLRYDSSQLRIIFETIQQLPSMAYFTKLLNQHTPKLVRLAINHPTVDATVWIKDALSNPAYQQLLIRLLFVLNENDALYQLIRTSISAKDMNLMPTRYLQGIAESVLTEKTSLMDLTFDGVWILRLLVSPKFVANCDVATFAALIARFRLVSLTLKKDEYDTLSKALKNKSQLSKGLLSQDWTTWVHQKQKRLMQFQADDTIRVGLNRLEEAAIKDDNKAAITVLSCYLADATSGMQNGMMFRLSNAVVSKISGGDLANQSRLYQWVTAYLPHDNFMQQELRRLDDVRLFDENGQEIGFVQGGNQAFVWCNDELSPLRKTHPENTVLYDASRCKLGTLSARNEVVFENVFQADTAINLLVSVPTQALSEGSVELTILLNDVLKQGRLASVYAKLDADKTRWMTAQVGNAMAATPQFDRASFNSWIAHGGSWRALLSCIKDMDGYFNVLHAVLNHDGCREACLEDAALWQNLSTRFGQATVIFRLLSQHHDAPWLFSVISILKAAPADVAQGFTLLVDAIVQHQLPESVGDGVMTWFLSSPVVSEWLLTVIAKTPANAIVPCFTKKHILPALIALTQGIVDKKDARFNLLLIIFKQNIKSLFPDEVLRYARDGVWFSKDIDVLHRFVRALDKDALTDALWGQLVFYAANYAKTAIFYDASNQIDSAQLARPVTRRMFPSSFVGKTFSGLTRLCGQLFQTSAFNTRKMLDDQQAIIHWDNVRAETFKVLPKATSLQVFLLNYAGNSDALKTFIDELLTPACDNKTCHDMAAIMAKFPKKDVSRVIYLALENYYSKHPDKLDSKMFMMLVNHYQPDAHISLIRRQLKLIHRWGHSQHYQLVHQACRFLKPDNNSELSKTVKKIAAEARAESSLNDLVGMRFFRAIAAIKRLWYCGFWGYRAPTLYVRPCDSKENRVDDKTMILPQNVRTSVLPGHVVEGQIDYLERAQALRDRVQTM